MIADSDFGDVNIERAIVEDAGFRLSAHQYDRRTFSTSQRGTRVRHGGSPGTTG
jgi:hypothetical protein